MKNGYYYSEAFKCRVHILKESYPYPYIDCCCCGKPIKTLYSVVPESDGLDYCYGSECIKKIGLKKAAE